MKKIAVTALVSLLAISCSRKQKIDLLIYNATIYTVDPSFSTVAAMAIKDGRIMETGTSEDLLEKYDAKETLNETGKFIYPGFIDAHAHFVGYANSLQRVNLMGTASWKEVLGKVVKFAADKDIREGDWIAGRGWDQNDWDIQNFPGKEDLDVMFEDNPVLLTRVDGHAAIANQLALDIAGVKPGDRIEGGEIEIKNGKLTGILIDNAVDLVSSKMPPPDASQLQKALLAAQQNCFAAGLTTIDDCGLDFEEVLFIDSLHKKNELKMRIYAMLSDNRKNFDFAFSRGKIKTERLNVRSFKIYADGALGSKGACLLSYLLLF